MELVWPANVLFCNMQSRFSSWFLFPVILLLFGLGSLCFARPSVARALDVRLVTDEAEAVLRILSKKKLHQPPTDEDWQNLFATEGYVRLKKRETAMGRAFEDSDFKAFVLSDALAERTTALAETLERWKKANIGAAARLALAYLPRGARIRAKIYPVIKPRQNSFVFEVTENPAIFLYLDPQISRAKFENTLAHELHHIGYGSGCPRQSTVDAIARLAKSTQTVIKLIGAFGEGFAMLAAAGGPYIHPHMVSSPEERARWDHDLANFNGDLKKVETFFFDVMNNRLTEEQVQATTSSFFGVQGPWYTVGWKMSVMIEKTYGRAKLIQCICNQRLLLSTYNRAAQKHNRRSAAPLALWSPELVKAVELSGP